MYIHANPNPYGSYVEDCVIRAIAIATDRSWDDIFVHVCLQAFLMKNMPSVGNVWGRYLRELGFVKEYIPDVCPYCYTIRDFCRDNPIGIYILVTASHAIAAIDGDYFDTWDSGDEVPMAVWRRV